MNLLFVCSRNQWRSPTAEKVWRGYPSFSVRSAGTSSAARRRLSAADVQWADVIFAMEDSHKSRILQEFRDAVSVKPIHVLNIADEYQFMDPELVEELTVSVRAILNLS